MLQFDYLTSLQKLYNLVFIPDELRPGHFHIETFADYMSAGDTKDWTSKVDYGKDVVIKAHNRPASGPISNGPTREAKTL